jgi:hypothetical protein
MKGNFYFILKILKNPKQIENKKNTKKIWMPKKKKKKTWIFQSCIRMN